MKGKAKQNKVLYITLIVLMVTAAVLIIFAGSAEKNKISEDSNKQLSPSDNSEDDTPDESDGGSVDITDKNEKDTEANDKKDTAVTDGTSAPVSLTVDDIVFLTPVNGYAYNLFSDKVQVFSPTMNDYRTHNGVDISAEIYSPVMACADGEIVSFGKDHMMGTSVRISHGGGVESVYRGLSEDLSSSVAVGSTVRAGDVLGTVGDTALAECEDEPHLHFELLVNGEHVDPLQYVKIALEANELEG